MRDRIGFLISVFLLWCNALYAPGGLPPLDHIGTPLPPELYGKGEIPVVSAPYPARPQGEIVSSDGHRCAFEMHYGGAGHTNDALLYFHAQGGKDLKVEFNPIYWDFDNSSYHWINENLLFVRIWWGRHWGSDYIFDADTSKMVYREGFEEHHYPIKPSQ